MAYKFWNDRSHGQTVRRCELSNFVLSSTHSVKSGCVVSWTSGMNINITSGVAYVNGNEVTVTEGNKTITVGDVSNPRLDLVLINSSGVTSIVEGTAATVPMTPDYTETDFACICMIYVPTNASTISSNEIENIGILNNDISNQGLSRFTNSFVSQTTLNISHSLNDSNPIIQVYDSNNEQITPDKIDIIDANNVTIEFSSATSGSYIIHGGNSGTINASNDIIPSSDNNFDIGSSTYRYQDIYAINVHTGDLVLQNGWTVVEYDENYNEIEGVIIRNKDKKEIFRVDNDGIYFKGKKFKLEEE